MDFFEEDEPADSPESRRQSAPGRKSSEDDLDLDPGRPSRQQILTRQLILAGVSVVVLILVFLAFRGCLDARKERGFKNYVSDLTALTAETDQLSDDFFTVLDGSEQGGVDLGNQVNSDRGAAQGLLDRAEDLDAPDQVAGAQRQIVLSYRLRRDGLDEIANQLPNALGKQGAQKAIIEITKQMDVFAASDVLYARSRIENEQALNDEEIVVEGGVPKSKFLPTGENAPDYRDPAVIAGLVAGAGGSAGGSGGAGADCDPGDDLVHGLGLVSTTALPSDIVLQEGVTTTVPAAGVEFVVAVQNQGGADESGVKVTLGGDFSGNQTINALPAGEVQDVTIVPEPSPSSGDTASLEVTVDTVCGEQVAENNSTQAPYELTFD